MTRSTRRPEKSEYHEYYDTYVRLVPEGDIVTILKEQLAATLDLLSGASQEQAEHRYAPGKWSVKEVVGHVVDIEWVFTHRALCFARGDTSALPGVEQDELVAEANFDAQPLPVLLGQLRHLRSANVLLFGAMDDAAFDRRGVASDCEFTVRSIAYIIAGHERHHREVLRERYLSVVV